MKNLATPLFKDGQSLYGKRLKIILCGIDRVVKGSWAIGFAAVPVLVKVLKTQELAPGPG